MATWFPCQHPEHVRIVQSVSVAQQLGATTGSILCVMAAAFALQLQTGLGWVALAWQFAMATLAAVCVSNWRRFRKYSAADPMSLRRMLAVDALAGCYGVLWAIGLVAWSPAPQPHLSALILAVAIAHPAYAAAAFYFIPGAVLAFSAPLFVAAFVVIGRGFPHPALQMGIALVAIHGLGTVYLLRRNWDQFVHTIDLDVEEARLAEMLQQQKEIAEKAVQLKSRFLASASHDLRQPMHAITLYLDGLAEFELPDRARRAVGDARECAHDMNDMFRSLLDMSRLDAQQAVPSLSLFPIATILSRVQKEFTPLAQSRNVRLKVHSSGHHVYSDPVMVERIALNFVSNAVRHASGGRVLVACRTLGTSLRLAVYDNGKGIPESDQQAIFEEFHRLDTARQPDSSGGLGLGLAIVRRLARTLRLPVIVKSAPGRGSMFAVDLPLVRVSFAAAEAPQPQRTLAGKLIVLIDDETSILDAASFILERAGCLVVGARSGREALDSLVTSSRVPDAIICDYELHDEWKGPAVIRALRDEFARDIPALLVTGDTGGGTAERLAREMGLPLLYKPLESATLRNSLGSLLST